MISEGRLKTFQPMLHKCKRLDKKPVTFPEAFHCVPCCLIFSRRKLANQYTIWNEAFSFENLHQIESVEIVNNKNGSGQMQNLSFGSIFKCQINAPGDIIGSLLDIFMPTSNCFRTICETPNSQSQNGEKMRQFSLQISLTQISKYRKIKNTKIQQSIMCT